MKYALVYTATLCSCVISWLAKLFGEAKWWFLLYFSYATLTVGVPTRYKKHKTRIIIKKAALQKRNKSGVYTDLHTLETFFDISLAFFLASHFLPADIKLRDISYCPTVYVYEWIIEWHEGELYLE